MRMPYFQKKYTHWIIFIFWCNPVISYTLYSDSYKSTVRWEEQVPGEVTPESHNKEEIVDNFIAHLPRLKAPTSYLTIKTKPVNTYVEETFKKDTVDHTHKRDDAFVPHKEEESSLYNSLEESATVKLPHEELLIGDPHTEESTHSREKKNDLHDDKHPLSDLFTDGSEVHTVTLTSLPGTRFTSSELALNDSLHKGDDGHLVNQTNTVVGTVGAENSKLLIHNDRFNGREIVDLHKKSPSENVTGAVRDEHHYHETILGMKGEDRSHTGEIRTEADDAVINFTELEKADDFNHDHEINHLGEVEIETWLPPVGMFPQFNEILMDGDKKAGKSTIVAPNNSNDSASRNTVPDKEETSEMSTKASFNQSYEPMPKKTPSMQYHDPDIKISDVTETKEKKRNDAYNGSKHLPLSQEWASLVHVEDPIFDPKQCNVTASNIGVVTALEHPESLLMIKVLGYSLQKSMPDVRKIVLVSDALSLEDVAALRAQCWDVSAVYFKTGERRNTELKASLWWMNNYQKLIFLNPETIVLKSLYELFECPSLCTAGDDGSGITVVTPSLRNEIQGTVIDTAKVPTFPSTKTSMLYWLDDNIYDVEGVNLGIEPWMEDVIKVINYHAYSITPWQWWTYALIPKYHLWQNLREEIDPAPLWSSFEYLYPFIFPAFLFFIVSSRLYSVRYLYVHQARLRVEPMCEWLFPRDMHHGEWRILYGFVSFIVAYCAAIQAVPENLSPWRGIAVFVPTNYLTLVFCGIETACVAHWRGVQRTQQWKEPAHPQSDRLVGFFFLLSFIYICVLLLAFFTTGWLHGAKRMYLAFMWLCCILLTAIYPFGKLLRYFYQEGSNAVRARFVPPIP